MRQVRLSNGTIVEVRGLLRREVRELRRDGMDPGTLPLSKAEVALDRILALVLPQMVETLEELPNADSMRVWRACVAETYGSGDEEKNSSPSTPGPATASA